MHRKKIIFHRVSCPAEKHAALAGKFAARRRPLSELRHVPNRFTAADQPGSGAADTVDSVCGVSRVPARTCGDQFLLPEQLAAARPPVVRLSGGSLVWGRRWAHISLAPPPSSSLCGQEGLPLREHRGAVRRCLHAGRSRKSHTPVPGTSWSEKVRGAQTPFRPHRPLLAPALSGAPVRPGPGLLRPLGFLPEAPPGGQSALPHSGGAAELGGPGRGRCLRRTGVRIPALRRLPV